MGLLVFDAEFRLWNWNGPATDLFGLSRKSSPGRCLTDLMVPLDEARALICWKEQLTDQARALTLMFSNRHQQGAPLLCNWVTFRLGPGTDGEPLFLSLVERSSLPGAHTLYAGQHERRHELNALSFHAIYDSETEVFTYVSPAALQWWSALHGVDAGMPSAILRLIPERERKSFVRGFLAQTRKRSGFGISCELYPENTDSYLLQMKGQPLDLPRSALYVFEVQIKSNDRPAPPGLTRELDLFNAHLHTRQNRLEVLGELSSGIMHDFRQPLGVIKASIENIQLVLGSDKVTTAYLSEKCITVNNSLDKLHALMDEVRVLASGSDSQGLVNIRLSDVLQQVIHYYGMYFIRNRIRLVSDISKEGTLMVGKREWLVAIIANLMILARESVNGRALDPGQEDYQKEIRVSSRENGNRVVFEISDNGQGKPPGKLSEYLDALNRNHGRERKSISKKSYLDKMKGRLETETRNFGHNQVRISFPLAGNQHNG